MPQTAMKPRRKKRRRDLPLGVAWLWSVLTVFLLGLIVFEIELQWPGTPLNNLWNLLVVNGQVSPNNPLIVQWLGQIKMQDMLLLSSVLLLGGGIVLGRLAPRAASRRSVFLASIGLAWAVEVLSLASTWGLQLQQQGGHLRAHQIDALLVATQLGWAVWWMLISLAGTWLGLLWRNRQAAPAQVFSKKVAQ